MFSWCEQRLPKLSCAFAPSFSALIAHIRAGLKPGAVSLLKPSVVKLVSVGVWDNCYYDPSPLFHHSGLIWFTRYGIDCLQSSHSIQTPKLQNCLKVVANVIIIDQWNQTVRFYKIPVTVMYSRAIPVAATSECWLSVKPGLRYLGHW